MTFEDYTRQAGEQLQRHIDREQQEIRYLSLALEVADEEEQISYERLLQSAMEQCQLLILQRGVIELLLAGYKQQQQGKEKH